MGLNQGAMGNTEVQMDYLGWAYSLAPQNPKYGYNYILTLYQNNKETEAKEVLVESLKLDPNNVKYLELKKYFDSRK